MNFPADVPEADISLIGEVTAEMARELIDQLDKPFPGTSPLAIEITTLGGDAEYARRMVLEIDLARKRLAPRRLIFLGKTVVYSAGVTFMAAFPREDRYLTTDAVLLIHCRQLDKTVEIQGPIRASKPEVEALQNQIETGIALEKENFERLIADSKVSLDDLLEKALYNWYLRADEAEKLGLVAAIV